MFGIGGQEIIIIGLLVLVIFGPNALPRMARDLGRFVTEARHSIDEFKEELTAGADEEEEEEEDKTEVKDGRKHRGKRSDEEDEHDL
jgi:Tat protein translocase TatB subunit